MPTPRDKALRLMAEIPFPTTWDGAKTIVRGISTTNLNWFTRISEPSTVLSDSAQPSSGSGCPL